MSNEKTLDAIEIIERVKEASGIRTDTSLAKALNVRQSTVASWRKRGNINLPVIIALCDGVNLNWLLFGEGARQTERVDPLAEKVMAMLEGMDEEQKRDVLRYAEKERLIYELAAKVA